MNTDERQRQAKGRPESKPMARQPPREESSNLPLHPPVLWNKTGILFTTAASLPFLESLLYGAHVGSGRRILAWHEYVQFFLLSAILWALMAVSFMLDQSAFRPFLQQLHTQLQRFLKKIKYRVAYLLYLLPILFLALFFGGQRALALLMEIGVIVSVLSPLIQLIGIVFLIWLLSRILRSMAQQFQDLKGTIESWAFGIRVSLLFYVLIIACTWRLVSLEGVRSDGQLNFIFAICKDYLLLFIISEILFLGLYKLGQGRRLLAVFQSVHGFVQFIVICGLIAILAVWADFGALDKANLEMMYPYDWQHNYTRAHIYIRDILLLLMPIAGLLFWSLLKLAEESGKGSKN